MSYQELKKIADDSRKLGEFEKALSNFDVIFREFPTQVSSWDYWGYAYCMLKLKRYRDAENYVRSFMEAEKEFQPVKKILAWTIYYQYLRNTDPANESRIMASAEEIISLVKSTDPYAPYVQTVFSVTGLLEKKFPYPASAIKNWISLLDPAFLKDDPFESTGSNGVKTETASPKEKYYMVLTRLLYEQGEYEECHKQCNHAMQTLKQFHYKNNIWFTRRSALCLRNTGKKEEGLQLLLEVHRKSKEWFIKAEIAELYMENSEEQSALAWLAEAALQNGDPEKKLKVYGLLAAMYQKINKHSEAMLHTFLVTAFRIENGWKTDENSPIELQNAGYNYQNGPVSALLLKKLKPIWEQSVQAAKPRHKGWVKSLLPHGKAGFIQSDTGNSYYFDLRQVKQGIDKLLPGTEVDFSLEDNFDPKHNKAVQNAVQIIAFALPGSC